MFYSPHFEVHTDFNALTYIKTSFRVNAGGQRWVDKLSKNKHLLKKEYSLKSKHNVRSATVSEISHSGEHVQQTMDEERLLFDQSKNPYVFPKPSDPNLIASGGYDQADSEDGRYVYDHQADNKYG